MPVTGSGGEAKQAGRVLGRYIGGLGFFATVFAPRRDTSHLFFTVKEFSVHFRVLPWL